MKIFVSLLITSLFFLTSCKKEDSNPGIDYLIFGHFYGFCQGEECIEIFKLDEEKLYEDTNDTYPSADDFYEGDFVELSNERYQVVSDLLDYFPSDLLDETDTVLGAPDASDGGGLYIEISQNGVRDFWLLDQFKENVPDQYHYFMDSVNAKIQLLQ